MKLFRNLHWFICGLFLLCCARQTTPTGGPKDTIPPILLKAIPANGQTKFQSTTIELLFNEMLFLNNPKEQIIIIPDVGKDFETLAKKNKVTITFDNALRENTTYSINFREAIQDITEKNPTENLKLAFSTGDYIDSLSIEGTVYDLHLSKPIKDATVAIYQTDTFNIFQHKPSYFSKTNEDGLFQIANLKPGAYSIYAIEDKNKNLIADSKGEAYGFLTTKLDLHENTKDISIPVINLDTRPLKMTSSRPSGTFYNIKMTKNLSHYKITTPTHENISSSYGEDHANIRIYNTLIDVDSIPIHLSATDSILQKLDTTLYLKFTERRLTPDNFTASNKGFQVIGPKGIIKGEITFNKPLLNINYDSIYYQIDSAIIVPITPQDIQLDTLNNTLTIHKQFDKTLLIKKETDPSKTIPPQRQTPQPVKSKTKTKKPRPQQNQLYIAPKTFISIEQDSSKEITQTVRPTTLENTGVLIVEVRTDRPNFIVQLLSRDYKPIASSYNTVKTIFEDLEPTNYMIRLIIDVNQDSVWTPGNFYTHEEPEPIKFYKNEKDDPLINLKANWELGPLFITY